MLNKADRITPSQRNREIRNITLLGSLVNILLSLLKAFFGYFIGSVALVADAVHSLSDLMTDVVVLIGAALGSMPADKNHPFGHGKLETMATIVIAVILIGAGVLLIFSAVNPTDRPINTQYNYWAVIAIAGFSVLMKEWLYQRTMIVAKATDSTAVVANAWHHRSDALSSVAVLVGAIAMGFGWPYGDRAAGLIVGLMVCYAGLKIVFNALNELGEAAVDKKTYLQIEKIVNDQPEIRSYHRLRTRKSGHVVLMDIHILVEPSLSLIESHNISKKIEKALLDGLTCPLNITVHVEPDLPSEQKNASLEA